MIFKPEKVDQLWDTWLYYHEGIHYLYYLHKSTAGGRWDGISVATSEDGVHFQEIGPVIQKSRQASWIGTGSIWRTNDGFALNFSETVDGVQSIYMAKSDDLIHWEVLGDEFRIVPDPRWYDDSPNGRWDCIWALPKTDGPGFWGYLTARPWNRTRGMRYESIGMLESDDGLRWRCLRPPVIDWGEWPQMNVFEAGSIECVNGTYYLTLCLSEHGLGGRQVSGDGTLEYGMYLFTSSEPEGPFRPQVENYRLLVSRATHFVRFYRTADAILLTHHSIEGRRTPEMRTWMPPLKKAVVDGNGVMRAGYWAGNEALKGREHPVDLSAMRLVFPDWEIGDSIRLPERIEIDEPSRGWLFEAAESFDLQTGAIIEGEICIYPAKKRWGGIGVYFACEDGMGRSAAIIMQTRGCTELVELGRNHTGSQRLPGSPDDFVVREKVAKGITAGRTCHLRVLVRHCMLEVYLDDELIQCFNLPGTPSGKWGLVGESGRAVFGWFTTWTMDL